MIAATLTLSGCGGGDSPSSSSAATDPRGPATVGVSTATVVFRSDSPGLDPAVANAAVEPAFHVAPVLPAVPSEIDANGTSASALLPPVTTPVPEAMRQLPSRALTAEQLLAASQSAQQATAAAAASGSATSTYSPAQIRAAYGLPPVPSNLGGLTALQLAQFGAGQTIYLIDAQHDLYAYGELLAFSQLFGLPACSQRSLAANAALPLPAASSTACEFIQVYATSGGGMSSTAPAYDAKWAMEIALDLQWAHAIAPLARLVLIEAPVATTTGITGAIQLANQMGPGAVSMSFTAPEGSYVAGLDSLFKSPGMSYFAATGDSGSGVGWPSVSPLVVAVGGTSLQYTGGSSRSESAWSQTGGGISAYVAEPGYQSSAIPGLTASSHRIVADVAMNADPGTGQFVASIANQATCTFCQVSWLTAGGTSLATPEWAAMMAISNALRATANQTRLGDPHAALYAGLASSTATYSTDFYDVTQGADGSCSSCSAHRGHDVPTGLGTPNGLALIEGLAGVNVPPSPPTVVAANVNGSVTSSLSFTASISSSNPATLSLANAPAGMTISQNAVVSWPSPKAGSYAVTVIAKDGKTGLTGQGIYTVQIAAPPPPLVSSGAIDTTVGQAIALPVIVGDTNTCTLTLSNAPAGVTISSTGVLTWTRPIAGAYSVTITAKDQSTGFTGTGIYTIAVAPAGAPVVQSGSLTGLPGHALSASVTAVSSNPLSWSLSGAPSGMTVNSAGMISWPAPVVGSYTVTIAAKDSKTGLSGIGVYTVRIGNGLGPAITASVMTGVAGKAFNGNVVVGDADASVIGVGMGGGPNGMSYTPTGGGFGGFQVSWPNPVAGSYTLSVTASDSNGKVAVSTIPVMIAAH